jgi:hypothetical protein
MLTMGGVHAASWLDLISGLPHALEGLVVAVFGALAMTTVLEILRQGKRGSSSNERREVPWLAESLLRIFARTKDIEALIGDFEEYFGRDCASGSERRAVARYWARVLRSLWPQIWQWINRVGWAALIAAVLKR